MSEIRSNVVFDGHGVVAQYIKPGDGLLNEDSLLQRDAKWIASNVSNSQYFLQIIKCDDGNFFRPVRISTVGTRAKIGNQFNLAEIRQCIRK